MKKIISLLTVCLCFFNICVSAASLADMTEKIMNYYNEEITDDISGINKLQNRRNIHNPLLISSAVKSGVIITRNGLVNEDGTDYTPLINGLIKRYINNDNFRFVAGKKVDLLRNKNVVFDKNTFFVTENSSEDDLNYTDTYTCVTDRENKALFVWKAIDVVQPSIYRVKLYWLEADELVATEMYRKEFDLWIKKSGDFCSLDSSQISVSQDFIINNLDRYVYVFADDYGDNIVVKGISD